MKQLSLDKTMTIKELSEVLGVSRGLIEKRIRELFPNTMKNGVTTILNEEQVTAIKLRISENTSLATSHDRMRLVEMPKTDLEKELLIQQAMMFQAEKIKALQAESIIDKARINRLIHDNKTYTTTEIAKELNMKSANQLNKELETRKIQYRRNNTWILYAKYSDCGYESIKQQELDNGRIIYNRHWTGKGRDFVLKILEDK